ncbi:MAG: hypothetical protein H6891_11215 [Brucellaceae bacterium]|nr:hypothetical protein [Brucellaceae bacterium]
MAAIEIENLVDTTGAGDLMPPASSTAIPEEAAEGLRRAGSLAAGLVIQQIGPRPQQDLRQAAIQAGLL